MLAAFFIFGTFLPIAQTQVIKHSEERKMEEKRDRKVIRRFISPAEASELFGINIGTLANYRHARTGCAFYKRGRKVLYDAFEFEAWIKANPVQTNEVNHEE
jgi:hypothetical protein